MNVVEIFAKGARDGVYPGGQLAVSREGRRLVHVSVGRISPGAAKVNTEVLYDLASLTKPLSSTLLLGRALERGRCSLADPIAKFVPDVREEITIEHILDHSAGFPDHRRFDLMLPAKIQAGSWEAWRWIVQQAAWTEVERRPGKAAVYSDLGFILLGAALEVMYGLPLSTSQALLGTSLFFRDRRGPPAVPPTPVPLIAPTEDWKPGFVHDENARAMGGAAGHSGLFGTAESVLRLAEQFVMAYHGWKGGPLEPDTIRRLWQPSRVAESTRTLGWDRPSGTGLSTGGRWPVSSVGHLGFTGTSIWIEPDRALVAVLVTNRVCPSRANNMIRRLRPALHDAIWEAWGKPRPAALSRAATRRGDAGVRKPPAEVEVEPDLDPTPTRGLSLGAIRPTRSKTQTP